MSQLNPQQAAAVKYVSGPLLVLAGAGSGKTSVITRKIAYLIEQCDIPARNVVAVTFTNKAAAEMKERVGTLIDKEKARGLTVSTFHQLGLNIIRREVKSLGLKNGFSILDQDDIAGILKDIALQDNIDTDQVKLIHDLISQWKGEMILPEKAIELAESAGETRAALMYAQYERLLKAYNAVDFDDLISLPVKLFRDNNDAKQRWQNRFRYILVDEYQDTNLSQYELVQQLLGDRGCLTVVGDDDQSIYAWRGARPENLVQLKEDYPTLEVIKLEQNYRSMSRILQAANAVIDNNEHVFEKKLWSDMGLGEPIRVVRCKDDNAEYEQVVNEIIAQRLKYNLKFSDFAVLYRGNFQSRGLELELQKNNIPFKVSGGTSFFSRSEVKDFMAYLRLILNPDDDNAFLRIINTPRRKIGPSTLEALGLYANERHCSLYEACGELGLEQHMPAAGANKLKDFTLWLDRVRRSATEDDPVHSLKEMLSDMDYEGHIHGNSASPAAAEKRFANILTLIESIKKSLEKADEEGDEIGIEEAIRKLVLRDLLEEQSEEEQGNRVQLMTLHASKGLEFPHVVIMGMEENLLPHRNSIDTDNIEEERRLCYVGITRAKRVLTMTLASHRKQYGEKVDCDPSRFLEEIPSDILFREGFGEAMSTEQNKQKGDDTLSSLKGMFADL